MKKTQLHQVGQWFLRKKHSTVGSDHGQGAAVLVPEDDEGKRAASQEVGPHVCGNTALEMWLWSRKSEISNCI